MARLCAILAQHGPPDTQSMHICCYQKGRDNYYAYVLLYTTNDEKKNQTNMENLTRDKIETCLLLNLH